jgi:hypothetical protein
MNKLSNKSLMNKLNYNSSTMVEKGKREEHPPWIGDNMENIITRMMAVPKGPGTARHKAKLEQTIEEKRLQEFTRVHRRNKNQIGGKNVHIQR